MQRPFVNALIVCAALGLVAAPLARAQERPEDKDHPAEQREAPHPAAGPARAPADQHAVRHDETVRNHETVINHTNTRIVQGGGGHWHSGDRFNGSRVVSRIGAVITWKPRRPVTNGCRTATSWC